MLKASLVVLAALVAVLLLLHVQEGECGTRRPALSSGAAASVVKGFFGGAAAAVITVAAAMAMQQQMTA